VLRRVRRAHEMIRLRSRKTRDAECGEHLSTETKMKAEAQSQAPDREATTRRFPLALFVAAELLCTGALVAAAILWM
jgi:hypothetical protein